MMPVYREDDSTHGEVVDEQDGEDHKEQDDKEGDDGPLVVLPDDMFERLPRRAQPEE